MEQRTIHICNKEVPVAFNLGTLLSYEEIVGSSFFGAEFKNIRERVALILSAVISANPETDIKFEDIISGDNFEDFVKAFNTVSEMSVEFFKLPKVVTDAEKTEAAEVSEKEKEKN